MTQAKREFLPLAQYAVVKTLLDDGPCIAVEFIVSQPSGELGRMPAAAMPIEWAEELAQALLAAARDLRQRH